MKRYSEQDAIEAIIGGGFSDPFGFLGLHRESPNGPWTMRTFQPGADKVEVVCAPDGQCLATLVEVHPDGFFSGNLPGLKEAFAYRFQVSWGEVTLQVEDPYRFGLVLSEADARAIGEGCHEEPYRVMGAQAATMDGIAGMTFVVWAPNAFRVSVIGDFNLWDGRRHVMRHRHRCGCWEIFIPEVGNGERYMFEIKDSDGHLLHSKADPFAFAASMPPAHPSVTWRTDQFSWQDETWMATRADRHSVHEPMTIYEVHAGSWRRVPEDGNRFLTYAELADQLIPYAKDMGFTHIQMMPLHEYPFYGSWGYQPTGLFATTSRYGTPDDFQAFVNRCHEEGMGLLLDWVPAHFPRDPHGLAYFDGSKLYEHADPRQGYHPEWNTLIYNFGRREVANFLAANAHFWLDRYHLDGLRVDAVTSMLYLDYGRSHGQWIPNVYGENKNLEAVHFLQNLNKSVRAKQPGALMIAEESTAWPGVSRPVDEGGLGFQFKWNLGWMNDTLRYMKQDPIYRRFHHDNLTFGLIYGFDEHFILPLSHDEVVHGKGSLIGRMPGDEWQRFANLRAYFAFMWTHPGKKLLFMGGELAQYAEWNHDASLDWHLLDFEPHAQVQGLVRELNRVYRETPALHYYDGDRRGFHWIKVDAAEESYLAYMRFGLDEHPPVLVVCNFTPVPRQDVRLGVLRAGFYRLLLNTDWPRFGGSNLYGEEGVRSESRECDGFSDSVVVTLPPLATIIFEWEPGT